jgi:hypothetical protein
MYDRIFSNDSSSFSLIPSILRTPSDRMISFPGTACLQLPNFPICSALARISRFSLRVSSMSLISLTSLTTEIIVLLAPDSSLINEVE